MKKAAFLLLTLLYFASCNQDKKAETPEEPVVDTQDNIERDFTKDDIKEDRDNVATEDETVKTLQTPADHEFAGRYRKLDEENSGPCSCDCLEVSFTTTSELCISPDEIFISARFVKTDGNTANVFLVEPTRSENTKSELPWGNFDRDTPIAVLDLQPNGSMVLDWKGFHINGELATDYALLGKKTLEGTYQRE